MTLDEMEKFAAGVIQDAEVLGNSLVPMHPKRHVPLARFVLLAMPVVRAAMGLYDKAQNCVDRPWMGCPIDHGTVDSWLYESIDALRAALEGK